MVNLMSRFYVYNIFILKILRFMAYKNQSRQAARYDRESKIRFTIIVL